MLSSLNFKKSFVRESKIVHKSLNVHRLARFVTEEAICLMFDIEWENIYTIQCWQYIVYVHAKGVSKFVSYADFPPILGVAPPSKVEFVKWRRRWRFQQDSTYNKQAPQWWAQFYACEFHQTSKAMLCSWDKLLESIEFAFNQSTLESLRELVVNH